MRRYYLSAQNTLVPIATSFFVIPFLINLEGVEVWQSITIGQGVGLLFAEIVQGSWNQLGPKIGLNSPTKLQFLYSSSLHERLRRFVSCALMGALTIPLVCETNVIFAEVSFFIWLMNGLNAHWITLGTGDGIISLKFFTIPRTIATVLGMALSYLFETLFVYLILILLTNIFSIISLKISFRLNTQQVDIRRIIDRKQRFTNTLNNLLAAGNSWFLLILVNLLYQNGDLEISILIRYSEFAFALMLVIPQLNHAILIQKTTRTSRIIQTNVVQAIIIVIAFSALFPIVSKHIFGVTPQGIFWTSFSFLCIVFLRSMVTIYIQDFLIPSAKFSEIFELHLLVSCSYLVSSVLVKATNSDWQILPIIILGIISFGFIASLFRNRKFLFQYVGSDHFD